MKRCALAVTLLVCTKVVFGYETKYNPAALMLESELASLKEAWPTSSEPVRRITMQGVPNFGKLNSSIWRSGQPTREGYQLLGAQGLKTVINLRKEFQKDKDLLPPGINYIYIPVKDYGPPNFDQAKKFIEITCNQANWPILFHCRSGEGRAGVMSALIRHSFDGWNHKKIMREAANFRVPHFGFLKVPLAEDQEMFIQRWEETTSLFPTVSKDQLAS